MSSDAQVVSSQAPVPAAGSQQESAWRAAIGRNADWYLERWRQSEAKGTTRSWNWAACLLSVFWFAYRKMWPAMIVLLVVNLVVGAVAGALALSAQVQLVLMVLISFVTGTFGNDWYRRHVAKIVAEAESLPAQAARRGGTSLVGVGVLAAIFVLASAALVVTAAAQLEQLKQQQQQGAAGSGTTSQGG